MVYVSVNATNRDIYIKFKSRKRRVLRVSIYNGRCHCGKSNVKEVMRPRMARILSASPSWLIRAKGQDGWLWLGRTMVIGTIQDLIITWKMFVAANEEETRSGLMADLFRISKLEANLVVIRETPWMAMLLFQQLRMAHGTAQSVSHL